MFDFDSISMLDPSLNVFISMQVVILISKSIYKDQVISKNTVEKVHNAWCSTTVKIKEIYNCTYSHTTVW